MFHEKDLIAKSDHEFIRSMTKSRVFMQLVEFEVPSFLKEPIPSVIQGQHADEFFYILDFIDVVHNKTAVYGDLVFPSIVIACVAVFKLLNDFERKINVLLQVST